MVKPGRSAVSISLALALLLSLCQCGNGTGDNNGDIDKTSGNKSNQSLVVKLPTSTATSTSVTVVLSNDPTAGTTISTTNTTISSIISLSTASISPIESIVARATTTASTSATTSTFTTSGSISSATTEGSESKLSLQSNGSNSSGRSFQLKVTQLKNDNEAVTKALQSTQQPPSSTTTSSAATTPSNPSTLFPPTSSSTFTASTSIHHSDDFATSIKSQQQHLQQRSKLWAPHSNVADFLKGIDDDVGNTTNSTESHYSTKSASSSSTSHKSNTNLPNEKVGQQTRSIRSIRLIANNNSSNSGSGSSSGILHNNNISPAKNFISSSFRHHRKKESQQARGEYAFSGDDILGKSSTVDGTTPRDRDDNVEDENDAEDNVAVFHVNNNNKFPVISSIRHYRSRKSFSRTRKSTNPNGGGVDVYNRGNGGSGRATGRDDIMMTTASIRDHFNYDSATVTNVPSSKYEKMGAAKNLQLNPIKTFPARLSFSEQTMKQSDNGLNAPDDEETEDDSGRDRDDVREVVDQTKTIYEMPQGDAPHTDQEMEDYEKARSRYYYGQVATRVQGRLDNERDLQGSGAVVGGTSRDSSSIAASGTRGVEHYGKIIDKPVLLRGDGHIITGSNEGQKSGYSSSDDTASATLYENSYFIPKDVSSSFSSTETTDAEGEEGGEGNSGRKRPNPLSSKTNGYVLRERLGSQERNSSILHRINKTFLSRSAKSRQQQQQQHLESRGSEGNEKHASKSLLNADLLVNNAQDLNHWPISPSASDSNTLQESEGGWEKEKSDGGHNRKGTSIRLPSGNSSKGINNYSSQSTLTTSGTSINTSNDHFSPTKSGSSTFSEANRNMVRDRDKLKGTLNDSDYAITESGKAHSLHEALLPSSSYAFPSEKAASGAPPTKKQQRNRSGQPKQQNKERRKQKQQSKGSKRPASGLPAVPNEHHDENASGSLSKGNNFHTSQGLDSHAEHNPDLSSPPVINPKDVKWHHQHKLDNVGQDSRNEGYPYGSSVTMEGQTQKGLLHNGQWTSYAAGAPMQGQMTVSTHFDSRRDEGNKGTEHDKLGSQWDKMNATDAINSRGFNNIKSKHETRSEEKSDNEELSKGKKSTVMEYFPRVESFSSDSAYGESSNDNLFDEYRPPGPEYYGGDSGDLPLYDGDENASALSGSEISPSSSPSSSTSSNTAQRNKPDSDIVTRFLNIVESQHQLGENCTPGTDFNLGEGVVDRYAQERFRLEGELAVNRANMLTRMWKYVNQSVLHNEYLLHAMVMSMVEFDDDIFAAGNCYDQLQYKNYTLFCPFAYRLPDGGSVLVKDLSLEYHYLGNSSEWFFIARKNAEKIIQAYSQFNRGEHQFRINETSMTDRIPDEILNVTYEDGKWSKPYFDCAGANIWMITYTVPFFGYDNITEKYFFKGTSGIDIDLRRVDIDQCPLPDNSTELNIFAGSDKCKNATTMCVPIMGLGFRRGSYRCVCKDGFYFPNVTSPHKYYNGTVLEEEYEKKFDSNDTSYYDVEGAFECLRCPDGCDTCVDDRPCVVSLNWLMRSAILILQCSIILMLPIVGLFTFKYSDVKVVRAASPVLLRFIVLGAFFIYCTILVMYPSPSVITCTLRVWLREIGFSLAYGALMLKTWRISVIFRVRSAKAIKITDLDLMKRLGIIVAMFTALLVIRTLVAPPVAIVSLTADDLKAWLCKTDWWDHSFTLMELSFLVWGIRLCIVVRKAPSEFNESKFISLAIYNEFLLSLFLNISMLFLQSPANPDLLYIIFFCHVQLTMTLLLCLIFGSKAYMVFRGQGKGSTDESSRMPTSKFISKGRSGQGNKQLSAHNSTGLHSSTTSTGPTDPNYNSRLSEDVQEEFRRLYAQLEELKERNMRLGNRHLVAKIAAMQEAADNILQAPASQINGQSHTLIQQQLHQLSPGNNSGINNCGGGASSSSSASPGSSGHSPHTKGKSPSAFGPLSDISEEENPLQSLSREQVQSPCGRGPKVLETSIDIVIQNDSSRKTVTELGDNEQENNLNNGFHPLSQGLKSSEEGGGEAADLRNTTSEGITRNKDGQVVAVIEDSSCQLQHSSAHDNSSCAPDAAVVLSQEQEKDKDSPEVNKEGRGCETKPSNSSGGNSKKQGEIKSVSISENVQTFSSSSPTGTAGKRSSPSRSREQKNKKAFNSPSTSPSKQQHQQDVPSSSSSSKSKHQQQQQSSSSTCQKSGGPSSTNEGKTVNHKDATSGSSSGTGTGGTSGNSQKIILDLDDKSRFTEEITV